MPASHNDVNEALTNIIRSHGKLDIDAVLMVLSMCRGRLKTATKTNRELSLAITKIQEAEMWLKESENEIKFNENEGFTNPSFSDQSEPIA